MESEPVWAPSVVLIPVNQRECAKVGHAHLLRDHGLLESACAKPINLWAYEGEEDVLVLACALLFGVARNHPFLDGNKRTAFVAADMFLQANGYELPSLLDGLELAELLIGVLDRSVDEAKFLTHLRAYIAPFDPV